MKSIWGPILGIVFFVGTINAWKVYSYQDCKRVGHSTFYCLMRMGN